MKLASTIERIGQDTIVVKGEGVKLDRYRIRLRSGDYVVWANSSRTVVKLMAANGKAGLVVWKATSRAPAILRPEPPARSWVNACLPC